MLKHQVFFVSTCFLVDVSSPAGGHSSQSLLICVAHQAAIKLGHWSDALKAADDALAIDEEVC